MTEKIEQVARAIWETRRRLAMDIHGIELEAWGDGTYPRANHIFAEARSAVAAMREPTDEMWAACSQAKADLETGIAWPVMIDAALAPPKAAPNSICKFCARCVFEPCQSLAQAQNACTLASDQRG
jgi:hypothetical protein